jgi:5-methylcytosine-specific restriction endonuclease McrA
MEDDVKRKYTEPFYRTRRWERLRAAVLRRDGYMCQESKRFGKRAEATTVHHVFPREEFPEYQWEPWNLISLAGDVHDQMHDRVSGALTQRGAELLRRVARKNGVEVPGRYRG